MSETPSTIDKSVLTILLRTRGLRAERATDYATLKKAGNAEALRKRFERQSAGGWVAASKMPRGSQLYRLSRRGAQLMGAPVAWATQPSQAIASEMLAVSALAWKTNEFLFLTHSERDNILRELGNGAEPPKTIGRFLFRRMKTRGGDGQPKLETHLHTFLAELRTPDQLAARVGVVIQNLSRSQVFAQLIEAKLFGITLAVPSEGVKKSLETKLPPVEAGIEIVEELQDVVAL